MIVNLDEMYGEDIPLLLPGGTPEYKIQELPDAVMPLVREYNELVERYKRYADEGVLANEANLTAIDGRMKNIEAQMDDKGYVRTDDGMWGTVQAPGAWMDNAFAGLGEDSDKDFTTELSTIDTQKAWGGIWIEATIRATALVASFLKNKGVGYHLTDDDKKAIRAELYRVLGAKMKITEPVKLDVHIIIVRAEQYIDTL